MKARQFWIPAIVAALMAAPAALHAQTPMGTAFTYQGQLKQTGLPVTNKADIKFSLWDDVTTPPGIPVGPTLVFDGQPGNPGPVNVVNGLFTVVLDFGTGIFTGDARWLEIEVRVPHDPGNTLPYTTLSPRQELTPAPYAIYAASSPADDDWMISGNDMYSIPSGDVGIGTTGPIDAKLQVVTSSGSAVRAQNSAGGTQGELGTYYYGVAGSGGSRAGVYGAHDTAGVSGFSRNGTGVHGGSPSGIGVQGGSHEGIGVCGQSTHGYGVYGEGYALSGTNYGVYGTTRSSTGYAGYFNGLLHANSVTASVKAFKIDHPLNPEKEYLYHSSVESPDMMNMYNGNVVLDAAGKGRVELPEWFDTLNRDFRYQLTAIGEPGPNLYIAEEISDNGFLIGGGEPGMKVSWQVTGIRQDPYANANRITVEVDKPPEERGKYLHPGAYGVPEEMGLHHSLYGPELQAPGSDQEGY